MPAFNEQTRLPSSLDAILAYLHRGHHASAEIIVVDDGSRDGTAAVVDRYAAASPAIRLLRNPGNRGKGYAIRHGMTKATGEWRLLTDADLSTPIETLDCLLEQAREREAAVVIGSRALDRSLIRVHQPKIREYSGRFFNLVMRILTGLPFQDTQCGFKLYRRDAAEQIFPRQQLDGFSYDVEDLFIARRLGFRAIEVPVPWSNVEGTKVSTIQGLKSFIDLLRIRWHDRAGRYR